MGSLRLSDLQVKASVCTRMGKSQSKEEVKDAGMEDRKEGFVSTYCKAMSQRDMSQQMLCAFDANSTGITARDLMLTTPRKSDGSKSLTWIYENKAVKWNKL